MLRIPVIACLILGSALAQAERPGAEPAGAPPAPAAAPADANPVDLRTQKSRSKYLGELEQLGKELARSLNEARRAAIQAKKPDDADAVKELLGRHERLDEIHRRSPPLTPRELLDGAIAFPPAAASLTRYQAAADAARKAYLRALVDAGAAVVKELEQSAADAERSQNLDDATMLLKEAQGHRTRLELDRRRINGTKSELFLFLKGDVCVIHLNGRALETAARAAGAFRVHEQLTLFPGDLLVVSCQSQFVYRSLRAAILPEGGALADLKSGIRQITDQDAGSVTAESIARGKPTRPGRVDVHLPEAWKRMVGPAAADPAQNWIGLDDTKPQMFGYVVP